MATPLFALRGVSQERGGRLVLEEITLDLPAHQLVALIGPSGAGKSSLIRLLDRLDDPVRGTVDFLGTSIAALPVRELRRRVGFVFQSATMFPGTVADNLRAAAGFGDRHTAPPSDVALAQLLAAVELDESYLAREAAPLSGGEQQRVSIARALATGPEVLLLDEPTSALDPEVAERFMRTVARLSREQRLSIVMVTHRLAEARLWSETTVMLEHGRVVETGSSAELFERAREERTREFVRSAGGAPR
ncbi:MAG: transporter related [Gemmatimonadetes bacterium]|nr:transporter related [Gemmatimonadota bacterium]